MRRLFERVTFACFCFTLLALAMIAVDAIVLGFLVSPTGHIGDCQWRAEIMPGFVCFGWWQIAGHFLNLPLVLFVYAPFFTIVQPMAGYMPTPLYSSFMFVLFAADAVLALSLIHVGQLVVRTMFTKKT